MRKTYIDNIKWITVVLVVIYHVIYMFNGVTTYGVIGPFSEFQPQDVFQYIVYPWFMFLLFVVSGMSARFELDTKETNKNKKHVFKDSKNKWYEEYANTLWEYGYIDGYNDNTFRGNKTITRAEAVKTINKAESYFYTYKKQYDSFLKKNGIIYEINRKFFEFGYV